MIRNGTVYFVASLLILGGIFVGPMGNGGEIFAQGYEEASYDDMTAQEQAELIQAQKALAEMEAYQPQRPQRTRRNPNKKIQSGDESFIAGPDWEFDGFVVGGQGQEVRSMFVVNDLVYANVGYSQGFEPGDRVGVFQRGARIRDPQSGRFLGFEVQKIGVAEITNRIEDETCSLRLVKSSTGIEIGDLVRRLP